MQQRKKGISRIYSPSHADTGSPSSMLSPPSLHHDSKSDLTEVAINLLPSPPPLPPPLHPSFPCEETTTLRMRDWRETTLLVDTIFEEDEEEAEDDERAAIVESSWHSHCSSLSMLSLRSIVDEWSRATGLKPDAVVCIGNQRFYLHKEPLTFRSGFFKRHLTSPVTSTITLPAPVTADSFELVAQFCYTGELNFAPSNVVALRIAAEWLEMTEDDGGSDGDENLLERTEGYLCRSLKESPVNAAVVLRTCVTLLGSEEETAAGIAGRCVEALAAAEGREGSQWLDEVAALAPEVVGVIMRAMQPRFAESHDRLYVIVDNYIKRHEGDLTEEEKTRLCTTVDCKKLSTDQLIELVRNPRMPLRFVMQAMLGGDFHRATNSRPFSAATATLGTVLRRDAKLRQTSHLKVEMELTNARIQSLERDVAELRRQLKEMKGELQVEEGSAPTRSVSMRFFTAEEIGRKGLGRRLVEGLKNVFRGPVRTGSTDRSTSSTAEEPARQWTHRRSHSLA